jgi:hypothetical protein
VHNTPEGERVYIAASGAAASGMTLRQHFAGQLMAAAVAGLGW